MEDRKFVCPCYRHEQDIAETGHCLCSLFVSDAYEPPDLGEPQVVAADGAWPRIVIYGAKWCRDTIRVRILLNRLGVPYMMVDVEDDPDAARKVMAWNGGHLSTPTIDIDGQIVTEPSDEAMIALLQLE